MTARIGSSQPGVNEAFGPEVNPTVLAGAAVRVALTHVYGGELLDYTDPEFPTIIAAGVYAAQAFVGFDRADISDYAHSLGATLDLDNNHNGSLAKANVSGAPSPLNIYLNLAITCTCTAGGSFGITVGNGLLTDEVVVVFGVLQRLW